jgi:hypothetical protein
VQGSLNCEILRTHTSQTPIRCGCVLTATVRSAPVNYEYICNLLCHCTQRGHELTVRQEEDIAEKIDEEVHMLQYKLDHVRRLDSAGKGREVCWWLRDRHCLLETTVWVLPS